MAIVAPVMDDRRFTHTERGHMAAVAADPMEGLLTCLKRRIGAERFELWFERKTTLALDGQVLVVTAPNTFTANWIRTKFSDELKAVGRLVLEQELQVRVEVGAQQTPPETLAFEAPVAAAPAASVAVSNPNTGSGAVINARFTLEEFVVGSSNQMAYHAACRVAENPGQQFNPLTIHGPCGLGKTHLLQGICQRFAKLHPGKKWLYLTGESFTNEFLEAIKTHKTEAFRRRIRSADLLVIDDVHFLANKKATQEEFLHTFNQIDAHGKQIVLASDCAPKAIHSFSEALTSRFVSGMVLKIEAPDVPTRLEILRRKAARNGYSVSEAVLMHLAQSNASSVRELEGLLMQVVAGMTLIDGGSPAAVAVATTLRDRTVSARAPLAVDRIVAGVAQHFGISAAAIMANSRDRAASLARSVAMYIARQQTHLSYPDVGRAMGNKNHSTVIAACQRVEAMIAANETVHWLGSNNTAHSENIVDLLHAVETQLRRA